MNSPTKVWILEVLGLALALSLAIACSSDSGEGDGGNGSPPARTPIGQELQGIAQLADQLIGANAEAYEGLDFAAAALESLFSAPAASAALQNKGGGGSGCIPVELQDITLGYDLPSQTYTSTAIPGAPPGGVRVLIYPIEGGAPNTDNNIGNLDITCTGAFPTFNVTSNLNVNSVDVLNVNGNTTFFDVSSYEMTIFGFLASADGIQRVNFGDIQSSGGGASTFMSRFGVTFTVGEDTYASLAQFVTDPDQHSVSVTVFKGLNFIEFEFRADLSGTGEVVSGPASFVLNPPAGSGAIDHVACFEGTFENMSVMPASDACLLFGEGFESTQLPPEDLTAIENGYDALLGMYKPVAGISQAGAAILAAAAAQALQ